MRPFSVQSFTFLVVLIIVLSISIFLYLNQNQINQLLQLTYNNNLSGQTSLPLSYLHKPGTIVFQTAGNFIYWKDGIFLYGTKNNQTENITPFALTGKVETVSDRFFKIGPNAKSVVSLLPKQEVIVRLLDKGDVNTLQRKNGKMKDGHYDYKLIKADDVVEIYNLKVLSKNTYSTTQIFVLKPW